MPERKKSWYHAMPSHLHLPLPQTLFPILYDLDSRDKLEKRESDSSVRHGKACVKIFGLCKDIWWALICYLASPCMQRDLISIFSDSSNSLELAIRWKNVEDLEKHNSF